MRKRASAGARRVRLATKSNLWAKLFLGFQSNTWQGDQLALNKPRIESNLGAKS